MPIEVSTDTPPLTAVTLEPLPRCSVIRPTRSLISTLMFSYVIDLLLPLFGFELD